MDPDRLGQVVRMNRMNTISAWAWRAQLIGNRCRDFSGGDNINR